MSVVLWILIVISTTACTHFPYKAGVQGNDKRGLLYGLGFTAMLVSVAAGIVIVWNFDISSWGFEFYGYLISACVLIFIINLPQLAYAEGRNMKKLWDEQREEALAQERANRRGY